MKKMRGTLQALGESAEPIRRLTKVLPGTPAVSSCKLLGTNLHPISGNTLQAGAQGSMPPDSASPACWGSATATTSGIDVSSLYVRATGKLTKQPAFSALTGNCRFRYCVRQIAANRHNASRLVSFQSLASGTLIAGPSSLCQRMQRSWHMETIQRASRGFHSSTSVSRLDQPLVATKSRTPDLPPLKEEDAISEVLTFWFGTRDLSSGPPSKKMTRVWFTKDPEFDKVCKRKFEALIEKASRGELESWEQRPASCLALVILLDQFSRNIYRDQPQAFAQDAQALRIAKSAIAHGFDQEVGFLERSFFYMPFEHSEDLEDQNRACHLFEDLKSAASPEVAELFDGFHVFAVKHRDVIMRFGRFPHRNKILGRESTDEEVEFLKQPGSRF